jgi:hypothetical protein
MRESNRARLISNPFASTSIVGRQNVFRAAFNVAEIFAVNPKAFCHFFLRPTPRKPQLADSLAKTCLKRLRHI